MSLIRPPRCVSLPATARGHPKAPSLGRCCGRSIPRAIAGDNMNVLSGDLLQGLNEIARMAIERPVEAMCLLAGEEFQHEDLMWIRACIMFEAARNMATENRSSIAPPFTEFDVHREFWERLSELVPGAKRVQGPSDGINVPDGWVEIGGDLIPVEVKRDVFNGRARNQLQRYMTAYRATRGIAVCPKFSCETDTSIIRVVCRPACLAH